MPFVDPDYSEAFKPIAAGIYTCRIVSCDFKTSKQNNRYINWKLETIPDENTVYYSTPIEGKGAGMFKHLIQCGDDPHYEGGRYDTDRLIGKTVVMHLDVKQVESNGKTISVFDVKRVDRCPADMPQRDDIPW